MDEVEKLTGIVRRINTAWLEKRPADLEPLVDPGMVMVFPGFSGRTVGRSAFMAGFADFCENAIVHDFEESDHSADVASGVGVASFRFTMVYERDGKKYRSSGRDLWAFSKSSGNWLAVWRTMIDVTEEEIGG